MKRVLLFVFLFGFSFIANAVTKTWTGLGGDNLWSNDSNWDFGTPTIGDDVIIGINVTIIIDAGSPIALNSIAVTNNSSVTFDCPETKNFRLFSTSSITPGLLVDVGSSLTLNTSNSITTNTSSFNLTYGAGVIASIYGTLILSNTGGAGSGPQLITSSSTSNYGILTVYSGGIIKSTPTTQNTVSSLIPVPTIIMKDGSVYEITKNGGSFPEGTWEANSLAKALSTGTNGPVFNGSSYGNLEWNCANQTAITFFSSDVSFNNVDFISTNNTSFRIKTGASATSYTMTVNGNLDISSTSVIEITGSTVTAGNGGRLQLKGNLNNDGTITTNGGSGTINDFELNGTSNQDIINTGTLSGTNLKFIMNGAGATLKSPLTLPGNLSLQNGKIKTASAFILEMIRNATYTTNLANPELSFIEGPMRKIGDEDFTFPIGVGQIYAPITFNNTSSSSATDVFTAEYIRSNPQSVSTIYGSTTGIDHISYVEYWTLNQDVGASVKSIALTVNAESFCKDLDNTFISRYDPVNGWSNEGGQVLGVPSYSGPYQMATLRVTNNNISSFGYFTLATNEPFADNPLPINLISFDAKKTGTKNSLLNWELAACCSKEAKFEIQKGEDNRYFKTIAVIDGSETNRFYSFADNSLKTGINYYRLKMTDADGSVVYSRIAAVLNGIKGLFISMSPTVVNDKAVISFTSSSEQRFDILLTDMMGRTIRRIHQRIAEGNFNLDLALNNLINGVYQLAFIATDGSRHVLRFIKQ